ncbi:hypothetical protein [Kitasatospora sp. NPDC085464]|uniref:hypothetical protein n=1 Tax=Kitasatospora sp. NPDC085464 TaxID=3364063 RepID=UPI0037C58427
MVARALAMGKDWEDGLLKAARRPGDSAAGWNDNYPALTSLMGAGGKFDKSFLLKPETTWSTTSGTARPRAMTCGVRTGPSGPVQAIRWAP